MISRGLAYAALAVGIVSLAGLVEFKHAVAQAPADTVKPLPGAQGNPAGPAGTAGVQVGELITSIEGRSGTDLGLVAAMNYLSSGTIGIGVTVQLGIDRAGTKSQIGVTSIKW